MHATMHWSMRIRLFLICYRFLILKWQSIPEFDARFESEVRFCVWVYFSIEFVFFQFFRVYARSWFEFFLLPCTILNPALIVEKILGFKPFRWSILMVNTSQRYPSIFCFFDFSRPSVCNFRLWLWDFSAVWRDLELKIRLNGATSIGFRGLEDGWWEKQKRYQESMI